MKIIDTHAHIDHLEDIDGALARAVEANVSDIIAVSINKEACQKNLSNLAEFRGLHKVNIHAALGLHPSDVLTDDVEETFAFIRAHINEAIAVGEVGLDYGYKDFHKNEENQQKQRDVFVRTLEIAKEFDKPIIIHSRNAEADCLRLTQEVGVTQAVFHWYSGPVDIMEAILAEGFFVSASPAVGYSGFSRKAMKYAPLDRILIETDTPVAYKVGDERISSEPKDVWRTLDALATLKDIAREELLEIVNNNARRFFSL